MDSYFETEVGLRSVSSSNTSESAPGRHQPGGTSIGATYTISGYIKGEGSDQRNLGRWSWMLLEGKIGYRTRVVQLYSIDNNKSKYLGSVYQQHIKHTKKM